MHRASVRQASHTGKGEQGNIKCKTCELKHKDELKEQLFIDCLQIFKKEKEKAKHTCTHPVHEDSQSCIRFTSVRRLLNCTKKKAFYKANFHFENDHTQRAEDTDINPSNELIRHSFCGLTAYIYILIWGNSGQQTDFCCAHSFSSGLCLDSNPAPL